jgi:hypothetical protein
VANQVVCTTRAGEILNMSGAEISVRLDFCLFSFGAWQREGGVLRRIYPYEGSDCFVETNDAATFRGNCGDDA